MDKKNDIIQNLISDEDLNQITGGNNIEIYNKIDAELNPLRESTAEAMEILRQKYQEQQKAYNT